MIVKILSHKRPAWKKVLEYILEHENRLFLKEKSFCITHNLKGNNIATWAKQFQENEIQRNIKRKDSVKLYHEIISFHKKDIPNITLVKMQDIAQEYIQKRNPKGMYVIAPHFDKDHYHIHVLVSGIEYRTGKAMRLSRDNFKKLKRDIQQYQMDKYPELTHSIVAHGKKDKTKNTEKEYQLKKRNGRETEKEKVTMLIQTCFKNAKSTNHFFSLLNENGLQTYVRGGRTSGVILNGYKFRLNRFSYTADKLEELDKSMNRSNELSESRNAKEKNIGRNR